MLEFKNVFRGTRLLTRWTQDETVTPVVHACRKFPFAPRERRNDELARMEKLNVVKEIDKVTDWVSSLIIVAICLGSRDVNRAVKSQHMRRLCQTLLMPSGSVNSTEFLQLQRCTTRRFKPYSNTLTTCAQGRAEIHKTLLTYGQSWPQIVWSYMAKKYLFF